MDGIHDLGGRQGFGAIVKNDAAFTHDWERRVSALHGALARKRVFNMDEYRHAIERMEPRHYMRAGYFERMLTALMTLCVEKQVFTHAQLAAALGHQPLLSSPSAPGRAMAGALPELHIGDRVRVREDFVPGHTRLPAYVRGRVGTIVDESPAYPFPDAAAHDLESPSQRTFDVCFLSTHLWPNGAEPAEVHVGLFHAYLEPVGRGRTE